ncbi:MAG: enoyl-CoA hydratase/isomerase family protein [Luminiphilus sp.]|nr:enoyl-CoA hydratase/isomerase family protein [Luminiphilus sp.]
MPAIHRHVFLGEGRFNPETLGQFDDAVSAAIADEECQILLLAGEGKNFSQGLDLEYLMASGDKQFPELCMRVLVRLLDAPIPVVSVMTGHAFGLGAMIALASDYRVMREDRGFFCLPEVDLNMTLTVRMNELVCSKLSPLAIRAALLTGERLTAARALELDVVDAVADLEALEAKALEIAAPMMGKNRRSLAGLKRGFNQPIIELIESDTSDTPIASPDYP